MASDAIHPTKVCGKCAAEKPRTVEFFHFCNGYPRPYCRPCWNEREKEYFWANREKKRQVAKRRWARADKALAKEKLTEGRQANPNKVRAAEVRRLERIKASPAEKAKRAAAMRRQRAADPERHRAARRANYERPEVAAKSRAATKRWREENQEYVREKERDYREANPEKIIANAEKRRARLMAAEGEFTGHDVIALIKAHGRICFYCGDRLKKFQVDHFIPLSRGGTNWPSNLVIACRPCNLSKAAKMPWEWMPQRFSEGQSPR